MEKKIIKRIFIVDDEPGICKSVSAALECEQYKIRTFSEAPTCLDAINANRCDMVISDIKMPEMSGMSLLMKIKHIRPMLPVILITGYGDVPMAVKAMKTGAEEFIEKPINRETLLAKGL